MDVDVRADGDEAYLAVLAADGPADARADPDGAPGERRVRLLVPASLLDDLGLGAVDGPFLARAAADVLAEDEGPLPAEASLRELDRQRPGFLDRVRAASGR
ncbi:hypothetical protein WDZ17_03180 [Pseudokineococcus basanitobsidens]|uniref:Uncharacterized protein n=1 Tax=Pseudokineococcus basanitobsidens TaxID=1926649 RepID=A0ABU8RGT7_9ACTN